MNHAALNGPAAELEVRQLEAQLRHCRAAGVDFVIAHLHWGMEFELYPRPDQLDVAHRLAELGVDAVIGHHPHVLQPVEHYRTRRDPERVVPIFYSLGNLTVPFTAPWLSRSGVARLELVKGSRPGQPLVTRVRRAQVIEVEQVCDEERRHLTLQRVAS